MTAYERLLRPLLFRLDPERVHNLALNVIVHGLVRSKILRDPRLEQTLFGVKFANPLGLAAGFDKDGAAARRWEGLGFGFAELGTVTRHPQPGNPKPRLFRLPADRALVNRMGFNNRGSKALAATLGGSSCRIPLGINLGKSKVTPVEEAAQDYSSSVRALRGRGDYLVVNVSSPNTPGLRSLQEKGPLSEILWAIQEVENEKPLFVKVAPDLERTQLDDVLEVAHERGITGLIATNTTVSRPSLSADPGQDGGLSGAPLRKLSNDVLSYLAQGADRTLVLMGVGGVFTGQDILEKLRLGACLVQVYTGWVYGGPGSAPRMLAELLDLMNRDGIDSVGSIRESVAHSVDNA